ncbi:MAG: hypothetical protein UEJ46_04260 [Eggerthellaceae bacterium]|nr:hypothetical protein [Eggerthellaceae bacterium]
MISDEERREVARKLRERTKKPMGKSMQRMFTETLGIYAHHISWMNPDKATNRWDVIVSYLADLIEPQPIDGNTSDGYHTFDELYHHRAVLFSVIVENFATRAWKSKLHADGTMYEGVFIVGIETPDGQATYHYDVEPYWNLFRCKEVDRAPEWDGHTPDQAIDRIGKLVDCKTDRATTKRDDAGGIYWRCTRCGAFNRKDAVTDCCGVIPSRCCANCGAVVVSDDD